MNRGKTAAIATVLGLMVLFGSGRHPVAAIPPGQTLNLLPLTGDEPVPLSSTPGETQTHQSLGAAEGTVAGPVTGGDSCAAATVVNVPVGAPGNPTTTTLNGTTASATGPDCGGSLTTTWWEAFQLDQCARVTIDFCGTTPVLSPSYGFLVTQCSAGGASCGGFVSPDSSSRGLCPGEPSSGNITLTWDALLAGTYYYPIIRPSSPGPYVMHITAEGGCVGACCDTASESCTDDVLETDCTGPDQSWSPGECCQTECRAPGPMFDSNDMNLLSWTPVASFPGGFSTEANDVWGYTSPRGRKYAIIGLNGSTGFVDITEPRSPVIVADIWDAPSLWSDVKVYREYAYNATENGGGLQVFDLRQIDIGTVILVQNYTGSGLQTSHTITVNPDSGYLYLNGSNLNSGKLIAVSLADPANPQIVGSWTDAGSRYTHDSQVVTYTTGPYAGKEIAFCYCGRDDLRIVDVTNKANMTTMSVMTYPTQSYTHQGWLTADRRYAIMNDELNERDGFVSRTDTIIVNVENLFAPSVATTFLHPTGCWIDHDEHVDGNRVYQAQYTAGVRVLDITNPLAPSEVAYFDTRPEDNVQDYHGVWGIFPYYPTRYVVASDIERGLFVLCDEPEKPLAGFFVVANPANCYVANFDASSSTHCNPARSLTTFEWDFDYDGLAFDVDAVGVSPTHAYDIAGTYTVALRVTDDLGAQDVSTLDVTVTACCQASTPQPEMIDRNPGPPTELVPSVKARHLSFQAGDPGSNQAIRVLFVSLPPPWNVWNGRALWVKTPQTACEVAGVGRGDPCPGGAPTVTIAELSCDFADAAFLDWTLIGPVHVSHAGIVPGGLYRLRAIDQLCDPSGPMYSPSLSLTGPLWGDVAGAFDSGAGLWVAPDGRVDLTVDVVADLEKFGNRTGAPSKTRADVEPCVLDFKINITDAIRLLDAFRGSGFPFSPGSGTCPSDPCTAAE